MNAIVGPPNIGEEAGWPSGRIFDKKIAYAGFYPDKISKISPEARFIVQTKIASFSKARWISELFSSTFAGL